jgi:hypothetical protein
MKPRIVLVHGALAESAGWDGVIDALTREGQRPPTRCGGWPADAAAVSDLVRTVDRPVVLSATRTAGA